jgi:hypothetical protein
VRASTRSSSHFCARCTTDATPGRALLGLPAAARGTLLLLLLLLLLGASGLPEAEGEGSFLVGSSAGGEPSLRARAC